MAYSLPLEYVWGHFVIPFPTYDTLAADGFEISSHNYQCWKHCCNRKVLIIAKYLYLQQCGISVIICYRCICRIGSLNFYLSVLLLFKDTFKICYNFHLSYFLWGKNISIRVKMRDVDYFT